MKFSESLKMNMGQKDFSKSAYYCGELLLINLKIGDLTSAYKFASDLVNYAEGEIRALAEELTNQLRIRLESGIKSIPEELIEKAEIVIHKVRMRLWRIQ